MTDVRKGRGRRPARLLTGGWVVGTRTGTGRAFGEIVASQNSTRIKSISLRDQLGETRTGIDSFRQLYIVYFCLVVLQDNTSTYTHLKARD